MNFSLSGISTKIQYREKKFLFSSATSVIAKGLNILVTLISLPFILESIGKERYGMMLAITAVAAVINFADLGLGFGLQNKIPTLLKGGDESLRKAVSSTFFFLTLMSCLIYLTFILSTLKTDWAKIFHLKSSIAVSEATTSINLFAFCLAISIPFSVIQKLQAGLQESYFTNIWVAAGNIFGLVTLYIVSFFYVSTPIVIAAIYGSNALFLILNFLYEFFAKKTNLLPKIRDVNVSIIRNIITSSLQFFSVQLAGLLLFVSNNIILIYFYAPEKVTEFGIAYKFAILLLLPLESSAPYITPAINDALVNDNIGWVNRATRRIFIISCIFSIVTSIIAYFGGAFIINLWLGDKIVISQSVLFSVAGFMLLYANLGCIISYIMLSGKFIKQKTTIYLFAVIITIIVKIFLIKTFGVEGAFWSTTVPMFLLYIAPCLMLLKKEKLI